MAECLLVKLLLLRKGYSQRMPLGQVLSSRYLIMSSIKRSIS